jgi:hypothetical protein
MMKKTARILKFRNADLTTPGVVNEMLAPLTEDFKKK